jgi:glycosyltransferase involved in cell wall biosynthesis
MKICVVAPYFRLSWSPDQPVELICESALELFRRGNTIKITTTDVFNKTGFKGSGSIRPEDIIESRAYGKYPFCFSPGFSSSFKKEVTNADIVYVHEYRNFQTNIVYRNCLKNNTPYFIQAHGSLSWKIGRGGFKKIYDDVIGKKVLRGASAVIAITEDEAKLYESLSVPKERIFVVPNGINFEEYQHLPQRGEFRNAYGVLDDEDLILYVGRLHATKGIDMLVRSFFKVLKNGRKARLAIIGKDYGYKKEIQAQINRLRIQDKVIMPGFLSKEEKKNAFVDSDVFVTPSYNGFPHTFLESCACGLPIITTVKGDNLNWLNGKAGSVTNFDENSITEGIINILADKTKRSQLSRNCRILAETVFDWRIIVGNLLEIFEITTQLVKDKEQ